MELKDTRRLGSKIRSATRERRSVATCKRPVSSMEQATRSVAAPKSSGLGQACIRHATTYAPLRCRASALDRVSAWRVAPFAVSAPLRFALSAPINSGVKNRNRVARNDKHFRRFCADDLLVHAGDVYRGNGHARRNVRMVERLDLDAKCAPNVLRSAGNSR